MPYIPNGDRLRWDAGLWTLRKEIQDFGISNGDLNYLMSRLALAYIDKHGASYNTLSDVVKAFECAKLEFYRRMVAPYEDKKAEANGDIYPR